jgi:hypothetical protein
MSSDTTSASSRATEGNDAERAVAAIIPLAAKFQAELRTLLVERAEKAYVLLRVDVTKGRAAKVDLHVMRQETVNILTQPAIDDREPS